MSKQGMGWEHKKRVDQMPPPQGQQCPCNGCAKHPGRCTVALWSHNSDADHVIPRAHGGHDGPLQWMCRGCNRSRGATLGNLMRKPLKRRPARMWA